MPIKKAWMHEVYKRFFVNYGDKIKADFYQFDNKAKRAHRVIIRRLEGQCSKNEKGKLQCSRNEEGKFQQFLVKLEKMYPKLMKKKFKLLDGTERKLSCKNFAKLLVFFCCNFHSLYLITQTKNRHKFKVDICLCQNKLIFLVFLKVILFYLY